MIHLASQSPRRRELLAQIGIDFEIVDVDFAEERIAGESPVDYGRRVARGKAGAGLLALAAVAGAIVIGADTDVAVDDDVLGKPRDAAEARTMLDRLSGRTHRVISAVVVLDAGREAEALSISEVSFAPLSTAAREAYIASGEWRGRAGAYAIQGRAAAFIAHLNGSYSGVMGLPLAETAALLASFGRGPLVGVSPRA